MQLQQKLFSPRFFFQALGPIVWYFLILVERLGESNLSLFPILRWALLRRRYVAVVRPRLKCARTRSLKRCVANIDRHRSPKHVTREMALQKQIQIEGGGGGKEKFSVQLASG